MSPPKRMRYVSEMSTSEDDSNDDYQSETAPAAKPKRTPKVFSKNAVNARENRLKKKMYLSGLENEVTKMRTENKKLSQIVDNQSFLIGDLRKQIVYLKSVIANSKDIGHLIGNIHRTTGMSVRSSAGKELSLSAGKKSPPVAKKTPHPYEDQPEPEGLKFPSYPTPSAESGSPYSDSIDDFSLDLFGDCDLPRMDEGCDELLRDFEDEHDYLAGGETQADKNDGGEGEGEDVGVCLHISKHRVSLEFCSVCSENAHQNWTT